MLKESAFYRGGYGSVLSPHIDEYIQWKQDSGLAFVAVPWYLRIFDRYCIEKDLKEPVLDKGFINDWIMSLEGYRSRSYRDTLMCSVRGFSAFLKEKHEESTLVPKDWRQPYKNKSAIAGLIYEFIEKKHGQGYSYLEEARQLQSFDRHCCEQGLTNVAEVTPDFINAWYRVRKTAPKTKDYRYLIRDFCIFLKTEKGFSMGIPERRFKEVHPAENYQFRSVFADMLQSFVTDKQRSGFKYDSERKILKYFDLLCLEKKLEQPILTKELVESWTVRRSTESTNYQNKRISTIRQFAYFLISRGHESHVARKGPHSDSEKPHIFKAEELEDLFQCADRLELESPYMRLTVPVIFRFYYCLGLRLNETITLDRTDIELSTGKVTVRMAKCLKDRIVYLPDDLRRLAQLYDSRIAETIPDRTLFFVSDVLGTKVHDTGLCRIFNRAWAATKFAMTVDKKPTIHCLRHTFVVRKLEEWYSKNVDYTYWLPYLCAHLGHSKLKNTYLYIHLVDSAFPQIRASMSTFERLYAEVEP